MSTLQLAGAVVFVLAAVGFLVRAVRDDCRRFGGAAAAVALLAAVAYGGLDAGVADVRHLAWLAALAGIAVQTWWLADADATWLAAMLAAAVLAVVAAFVAGVAGAPPADAVSQDLLPAVVAAVLVLAALGVLFTRFSAAAGRRRGDVAAHFSVLRNVAALALLGYAMAWTLAGAGALGADMLEVFYLVVDLLAVVAFNGLLLRDPSLLRG